MQVSKQARMYAYKRVIEEVDLAGVEVRSAYM